jgi:hypothetical protein
MESKEKEKLSDFFTGRSDCVKLLSVVSPAQFLKMNFLHIMNAKAQPFITSPLPENSFYF